MIDLFIPGVMLAALLCALALTPLARALALKAGFVDQPGERKIHARAVAYGGGVALALAMALAALLALWLRKQLYPGMSTREDTGPLKVVLLAAGAGGMLLLGLVDDFKRLSPAQKLAGQFVLAILAVAGGIRVTAFIGDTPPMQIASVLWIVLITNSFNLLDNMDGLCAGVAGIGAALLALIGVQAGQWNLAILMGALSGACFGFLAYNRTPASIFLGDAGSLFCGYLMACGAISATYYERGRPSHLAIGIPLLILAIPLYDTFSVVYIRLKDRRPIMRGDTSHFSHRLVDLGMSRRMAVAAIHLACLAIGLPAIVLAHLDAGQGLLLVGQALLILALVAMLERAGRLRAREPRREHFDGGAPPENPGLPAAPMLADKEPLPKAAPASKDPYAADGGSEAR